jgi:isoleucyl-tRNA synthetase
VTEELTSPTTESFSFVDAEKSVLTFWREKAIFKRSLEQTRQCPPYIFYDGPPFATGLPHHGHLVGNILKDAIPRYFTMKGRYVERRFGWDCHGLPIEHEIDKKLGMSAQDAVRELGVKGYNDQCRGIVDRYVKEWEKTVTRIGRWVDFENDYKTMDVTFMESVWWVFKQLWDKGLIYQGTRVVPFSTSLGTVLSNFEAGQNYQDVQDPAITVLFKLDDEDASIAAWTTTPWTLPSNLGLCAGADIDYVLVHDKALDQKLYLAKAALEAYGKKRNLEVIKELKGSALKGRSYQPLFSYFSHHKQDGAFRIFNDAYVTTDTGTGFVHLAPAFGEDDNRVMKEAGVQALECPIDDNGRFTKEVSDYSGQYVKEADKQIMKDLKAQGKMYEQGTIVHSYPFCYRSDTPLIYKAIPSWYVSVEKIKDQLLASNQEINWVPDHIKNGRFGKWLEGARDWSISRNRIWGTPLPIWQNDETGDFVCVGSREEIKKLTNVELHDLHREHVDDLSFSIDGQPGVYRRISEVLDCWFESGSMPYAQIHYPFENQELFKEGFPAEFIAEGLDQTRGWFYTLTILSTALYQKPAFKNVIVNGIVMAEDGKKMSKRLRNYTAPDELMETYGADALRLYLINSGLVKAEEQRFSDAGVKDMVRRALLPWYNSFKFFQTYAQVDGWSVGQNFQASHNITDNWVLSSLQTLKKNIAREMEGYRLYNVVPALFNFIEDLTNWYIRLNRNRFWEEGLEADKCEAYSTLYTALLELTQAMAPFAPFLSEHIYRELLAFEGATKKLPESVHLCTYPEAREDLIRPELEEAMGRMQQIILLGRQKRNQVQIKVKTPLARLTIVHKDRELLSEIQKLEEYIRVELNVKSIVYEEDEERFITLTAKPNLPVLGKRLGKKMGAVVGAIKNLDSSTLARLEAGENVTVAGETLEAQDLLIMREAKPGTEALSNRYISIDMDCTLNTSLIQEGLAREVVNRIQRTRKELGFKVDDRIQITYKASSELALAISQHLAYIQTETLCDAMETGTPAKAISFDIDGEQLELAVSKR